MHLPKGDSVNRPPAPPADGQSDRSKETAMKKSTLKSVARTAKQSSDDQFWDAASRERDPEKNLRITEQISDAIKEHEINMGRTSR
jgi:hypothetical protein